MTGLSTIQARRVSTLRALLLFTLAFCYFYAVINFTRGIYTVAVAQLIMGIFSTWLFFHLKHSPRPQLWSFTYLVLFFSVMVVALSDPGLSFSVFVWIMIIPAVAVFLLGRKAGFALAVFYMSAGILVYYLSREDLSAIGMINIIGCSILLIGMTYVYEYSREKSEEQLQEMAETDPLTGLLNRSGFKKRVDPILAQIRRADRSASLLSLDLDWFKLVNDRFGHEAGDQVLQAVAETLRERLRSSDVVCRWGGEEFLYLLPDTDRDGAAVLAEDVRSCIEQLSIQVSGGIARVTASVGVVSFPEDTDDPGGLLLLADQRLYAAKSRGRNRVVTEAGEAWQSQ